MVNAYDETSRRLSDASSSDPSISSWTATKWLGSDFCLPQVTGGGVRTNPTNPPSVRAWCRYTYLMYTHTHRHSHTLTGGRILMSSTSETEVNFLSHSLPNFSGGPSSSSGRRANWRVELMGTESLWRPPRSCTRSTRIVFFRHAMKISPGKGRHECMCGECVEVRWVEGEHALRLS